MVRRQLRQEILLPSCGAMIFTGQPAIPQVATCIDVYVSDNTPMVGETITIDAILRRQLTNEPLAGKPVYYLIGTPTPPPTPPTPIQLITDGNGRVTFTYTVQGLGVHRIRVVFRGEDLDGDPLITIEQAFALCVADIISCLGEGIEPPPLPPIPGVGQPVCGILCGEGLNQDLEGLEPE